MDKVDCSRLEYVKCALCGCDKTKLILTADDKVTGLPGQWNVVQCEECGLVYTNPRPNTEYLSEFYPDSYPCFQAIQEIPIVTLKEKFKKIVKRQLLRQHFNYFTDNIDKSVVWKALTWMFVRRENIYLTPYYPSGKKGKILEIGCSTGKRLKELRDLGWDVAGIEFSEYAVGIANEQQLNVKAGSVTDYNFEDAEFDAVMMSMCLEHLPNPKEVVARIHRWLKPGGELLISIPDFNGFESKVFKHNAYGLQVPTHLYHYSPVTIKKMLEGFSCNITHQYFHRDLKVGIEYTLQEKNNLFLRFASKLPRFVFTCAAFFLSLIHKTSRMSIRAVKI